MITLNYRDARPIYEQVRDGLRRLIVSGAIADGEKLPSVRALASQLAINPNTIQRAYNELESEGYAASESHPPCTAICCSAPPPRISKTARTRPQRRAALHSFWKKPV